MHLGLSERTTKYHGRREKVAVLTLPGRGAVPLALSDTVRCAQSKEAARRTVANLVGEELSDAELDEASGQLHVHCRVLQGVKEDPKTRR